MILAWLLACGSALPEPLPTPEGCPTFSTATKLGKVDGDALAELSGLVSGRKNQDVFWVHNDSGDSARIFAIDYKGKTQAKLDLSAFATAVDWEDIAIGPGPDGMPWIYVADTGDNRERRDDITIYGFPEPLLPIDENFSPEPWVAMFLKYPDGAKFNSETLLVDPREGGIYLVTKSDDGVSRIFEVPGVFGSNTTPAVLEKVGELTFGGAAMPGSPKTTAGDISPSGDAILIKTYESLWLWERAEGQSVAAALQGRPCPLPIADEEQGEAVGFLPDGNAYVTVSEGKHPTLWQFNRL